MRISRLDLDKWPNRMSPLGGSLTANGQVYLLNSTASPSRGTVNVGGGFVASTLGISDADFISGKRTFTGSGAFAAVSNAGPSGSGAAAMRR